MTHRVMSSTLFSRRSFLRSASLSVAVAIATASCNRQPTSTSENASEPSQNRSLHIGMNLWAGFMPWKVAQEKGLFKANNIDIEVTWFPVLSDQLTAFNSGRLDVAGITLSDAITGFANGLKTKMIAITDFSLGADAILATPAVNSIQDLAGKRASVEIGTVGHLLFLKALEEAGIPADQVEIVNQAADAATAALIVGKTDAAYSYEPFVSQAVQEGKAKVIFSSKDIPGLIPDALVVHEKVLEERPETVQALVKTWYETLDYRKANLNEVLPIEAEQAGVSVEEYSAILEGFAWLTPEQSLKAFEMGDTMESIPYSANVIGDFMLAQKMITKQLDSIEAHIDRRFVEQYLKS
ncbi:ABC transporter substrate-binding protein [Leptolyngbya sp. FACHB-671]|uniref:ABC transporter substrate-binding protein n=1 Tax=Leptolyngbya sp. FACHB-671 TaxID=2692812 RepID=UPI001685D9C9|nr:ABC transporter substrate-binding protein [Leptolyngbya sp. FACHB-671]MBD1868772.1 ABC transporter substrate-binding protein [Cyanobacteria bacterium FACHB-471]MBD2066062.1 ABC transporter substrate-binding protein [Leptolyngbya sp. FACHB-671]